MTESEDNPILGGVLTRRYRATLVAAAVLILVVGFALRPSDPASKTAPPPSQSEMRNLQRLSERQSLESMTRHFAGLAQEVATGLVRVGSPPVTGIVWNAGVVVTRSGGASEAGSVRLGTATGESLAGIRVVEGPGLPLAALEVGGLPAPVTHREPSDPELAAGQWLVAVWRGAESHLFAPGHFLEFRSTRCGELSVRELASSLELSESMEGGGLFDLDGALIAVVLPCDERSAALGVESVNLGLVQGRSQEGRLRSLYGMRVVPLDPTMRTYCGAESGVLVSEVWTGFAADLSGLLPGDVIASIDSKRVTAPADLQPLLAPASRAEAVLGVWRARRKREVRLQASVPEAPPTPPGDRGLGLAPAEDGFLIGRVSPGSTPARSEVREGDRLLRVNFSVPRTRAEADRALSGQALATFVEVRRGARRFGFLLDPR